ncbi:hypothetical protein [Dolichospermum flos-aquae]|uniref:Uncharacterized protein n=1 Tax=Dolichospermum flos-aquae LEGE 04289 TaxID=1828708 RepID=A0ACC5Q0F6_DOLFA|nr:hypothetical protein [Dolichospermum flos-aquae]MBE9218958.1 hypothetical protein [Dolichospermum flos-aquae LEGE 04289]
MCDIKLVVEDFIIDSCMGKFTLSRLLPLVVGSAAAGVLASMSPAKAVVLTVAGTSYNVTTINGTYNDNNKKIESTPWWGDMSIAQSLSSSLPGNFAHYEISGTVHTYMNSNPKAWDSGSIHTYAVATPVPFDISGSATIPAVGALLLAARWKARKSIASKTRTANPDVAVP